MRVGTKAQAAPALQQLDKIISSLGKAYNVAGQNKLEMTNPDIAAARAAMDELLTIGERLGSKGVGIPFFSRWET
jgi:hypothetical protein